MSDKILLRRGNKADLPVLNPGEPGFSVDTKELFIGHSSGNQKIPIAPPTLATWITPTMLNAWINYGSGFSNAGYYKDDFNIVHLRGLIKSGTIGQSVFQLPVGYRPSIVLVFTVYSSDVSTNPILARVDVPADGNIRVNNGNNNGISLDGISFRAEQ